MKNSYYVIIFGLFSISVLFGQEEVPDTVKKIKSKKGWTFGAVPAIAFDSDIGFKFGAVVNLFDYGNGESYPEYHHSLYFEYSLTTRGSGIKQFTYDSKYLIPGIRVSAEVSHLTERALDFYGFNGYESLYDPKYEDDSQNDSIYISRQFYRQERKLLRVRADFQGRFFSEKTRWLAGVTFYNIKTDTIDVDRLNKGKNESEKLPYVNGGLYGDYVSWGIIPTDQVYGGSSTLLKTGLIIDTRSSEANAMKGIWSEILLFVDPGFSGYAFGKLAITHRQYFTLIPNRMSFVYRLGYQAKLWGEIPYYMLPLILNGGNSYDRDGLGGAKTVRGMMRNRVVGEDYFFGNIEMRWKFVQSVIFNQNIYLAVNTFCDFGRVTRKFKIDTTGVPANKLNYFPNDPEKLHTTLGVGFHVALNENFIIAINEGFALDKRDGSNSLYIGLNWLF